MIPPNALEESAGLAKTVVKGTGLAGTIGAVGEGKASPDMGARYSTSVKEGLRISTGGETGTSRAAKVTPLAEEIPREEAEADLRYFLHTAAKFTHPYQPHLVILGSEDVARRCSFTSLAKAVDSILVEDPLWGMP